jgi:hypothetical protein
MKLKSLLLGSAAVMVAVSGARAADAIVIEPEPVEYVRVCDAYGSGWFYIPGTETCLKFDGDVRVQYEVLHFHDDRADETSLHDADYRARLNVRANNETEYGTLASRIRFVGAGGAGTVTTPGGGHNDVVSSTEGPGSAGVVVDWAVISLAGFRVGYADSYWATAGSYGFYNARYDGPYSFRSGLFFDYTWASNGWTATVGIEDGNTSGEAGAPDLYAGITYSGGGWYMAGIVYHDSSASAQAYKFRADYDMSSIAPGLAMGGWYMDDHGETDYVKGHAWGLTAKMNLTDNMVLFGGYGDYADTYANGALQGTTGFAADTTDGSFTTWTAGISWNIVPGLLIQPEYQKVQYKNETNAGLDSFGQFSLRIVRSF